MNFHMLTTVIYTSDQLFPFGCRVEKKFTVFIFPLVLVRRRIRTQRNV